MANKKFRFTKVAWRRWVKKLKNKMEINYTDNANCACAQFVKAETGRPVSVGPGSVRFTDIPHEDQIRSELPEWLLCILEKSMTTNGVYSRIFTGKRLKEVTRQVIGSR